MTDEYIDYFLNEQGFAPAIDCQHVDEATLQRFQGELPDQLLHYWKEYGFCGYGEGLFWTVDPADYEDLLKMWLEKIPLWGRENFYVIARTAFGELYVRGDDSITSTIIDPHLCNIIPGDPPTEKLTEDKKNRSIGLFFESKGKKGSDYANNNDKPLFKKALKKLGPLQHDEMYAFVPALSSGGIADIKNIKIVKIKEQLAMLAELDTSVILPSVNELFG